MNVSGALVEDGDDLGQASMWWHNVIQSRGLARARLFRGQRLAGAISVKAIACLSWRSCIWAFTLFGVYKCHSLEKPVQFPNRNSISCCNSSLPECSPPTAEARIQVPAGTVSGTLVEDGDDLGQASIVVTPTWFKHVDSQVPDYSGANNLQVLFGLKQFSCNKRKRK